MRKIQRPSSISFSHLPVQQHTFPGSQQTGKAKLKKVQSQSVLPQDVPPLTQLGQEFQAQMETVIENIRTLFVSQAVIKKLEQICEQCSAAGLEVTESTEPVTPDTFFHHWDSFIKEISDCFGENALLRSQSYFRSELAMIKSAIRTFTGPRDRMTITSEISTLETQLNTFRVSEKRIPGVRKVIERLIDHFSSFPSSSSPSHVELLRIAELKLGRLSESLDEYANQEPHANEVIDKIEEAGRWFSEMFAKNGKSTRRRSMPSGQRSLLKKAARVQEVVKPSSPAKGNEKKKAELERQIAEKERMIFMMNTELKACSTRMVRSDLMRVYADYNKQVEELNGRANVVLKALEALFETGEESQTVVFSNTQLRNEAQLALREVTKFRNEFQFLGKQRNKQIVVNQKGKDGADAERVAKCYQFAKGENADIEDHIRLLEWAVEDEKRFQSTIRKRGEDQPNTFVEGQIERLKSEIVLLDSMVAAAGDSESIPPIVDITDRATFDEDQSVYDRMKEIQFEYHGNTPVSPQRAKELEKEFSELESQIPDWQDTYEGLNNLNLALNELRDIYSQNLEEAAATQQELIGCIGNKEVLEGEMSLAVTEASEGLKYNRKQAKALRDCFRQRMETTRKLKLVEDMIGSRFPGVSEGEDLLEKIRRIRESLTN